MAFHVYWTLIWIKLCISRIWQAQNEYHKYFTAIRFLSPCITFDFHKQYSTCIVILNEYRLNRKNDSYTTYGKKCWMRRRKKYEAGNECWKVCTVFGIYPKRNSNQIARDRFLFVFPVFSLFDYFMIWGIPSKV